MQCTDCTETVRTYWNTLTKFDNPLGGHFAATAHSRRGRISGMHSIHHDTSLFILVPFRLKILTPFPSSGNRFQLCMQKTSENVKALRLPSKATASFQIALRLCLFLLNPSHIFLFAGLIFYAVELVVFPRYSTRYRSHQHSL